MTAIPNKVQKAPDLTPTTLSPEVLGRLILNGDCTQLTPLQRIEYYGYRCQALGLDPNTHPFEYVNLSGKLVLYAKAAVAQQLCRNRGLSTMIISQYRHDDGTYVVQARVTSQDARSTDNIGAVSLVNLKGEALCNAMMKATTKAIRRAVLAHEGLGMLDETEVDSVPGAVVVPVPKPEEVVHQPEIVHDVKHPEEKDVKHEGKDAGEVIEVPPPKQDPMVYFTAVLDQLCGVAEGKGASVDMREAIRIKYRNMAASLGYQAAIKSMVDSMAKYS